MKKNRVVYTVLSTAAVLLFSACGGSKGPDLPSHPITKNIPNTTTLSHLRYSKTDSNGKKFTKEDVMNAIVHKHKKMLQRDHHKQSVKTKNLFFKIHYSQNFGIATSYNAAGLITTFQTQNCTKKFTIGAGTRNSCDEMTTMKYISNIDIQEKKDHWDINLNGVSSYTTHAPENAPYYANPESLVKVVNQNLSNIKTLFIARKESLLIKGEIPSNYPIAALKTNFKRSLQKKSYTQNQYKIMIDGKNQTVTIDIFPYRQGSKVSYALQTSYDANKISHKNFQQKVQKLLKEKISTIINM